MLSFMFGDGVTDPLTGGSGWLGAGMLSLVIFWLLYKHIPSLMSTHIDQVNQLAATFKSSLDKVVEHCEEEMKGLSNAWTAEIDRLVAAIAKAKSDEADRIVEAVREQKGIATKRPTPPKHLS